MATDTSGVTLRRILILACTVWILGILLFIYAKMIDARIGEDKLGDFAALYLSAQSLREGHDPYGAVPANAIKQYAKRNTEDDELPHPNLNTPPLVTAFSLLTLSDLHTAFAIWSGLSMACLLWSAWLLACVAVGTDDGTRFLRWLASGLFAICLLLFYPSWANAHLGQFGQLVMLPVCGAWLMARQEKDRSAGILLGLALVVKPFTGIFLLLLPWLGRWRLLRWYVGSFAVISLAGMAIVGLDVFRHYLMALGSVNWYGAGWNASLLAPLSILLGGGAVPGWLDYPMLSKTIWLAISAFFYALLIYYLRRQHDRVTQLDLCVAGAIPLMLLASPLGWVYYFPLLGITALAIAKMVRPLRTRWIWWASTAIVLILCSMPFPFAHTKPIHESLQTLLSTSADTFALVVAFLFVIAVGWRMQVDTSIHSGRVKFAAVSSRAWRPSR